MHKSYFGPAAFILLIISCLLLNGCGADKEPGAPANDAPSLTTQIDVTAVQSETEDSGKSATSQAVSEDPEDTSLAQPGDNPAKDSDNVETDTNDTEGEETMTENIKRAELTYFGHASMKLTTPEGKIIYIDPFFDGDYSAAADLILETHSHYDHSQLDMIKNRTDDCLVITEKEALAGGKHNSFEHCDVKITAVEAGNNKNHSITNCVGFILEFSDGVKLYVSGDTSKTDQMSELASEKLDYAFFCCDGVYNMGMSEAIDCAKLVAAAHSIPYHMIPADNTGFDRSVAESFDVPGRIIIAPGEVLELTP